MDLLVPLFLFSKGILNENVQGFEYCTILIVGSQGVTCYMCELTVTWFRIWWYALW